MIRVRNCARCGGDHDDVVPEKLDQPMAPSDITPAIVWTHFALCPTNGQPIMFALDSRISAFSGVRVRRTEPLS